jgi:hypothetical protein
VTKIVTTHAELAERLRAAERDLDLVSSPGVAELDTRTTTLVESAARQVREVREKLED